MQFEYLINLGYLRAPTVLLHLQHYIYVYTGSPLFVCIIIVHPVLFFFSCLLVDLFLFFVSGSMQYRCTRTNFRLACRQLHLYTTVYRPKIFVALLSFFFRWMRKYDGLLQPRLLKHWNPLGRSCSTPSHQSQWLCSLQLYGMHHCRWGMLGRCLSVAAAANCRPYSFLCWRVLPMRSLPQVV